MKCISTNGVYQRVSDEVANNEVSMGRASFAPKSEWKKNTRGSKSTNTIAAQHKGSETRNRKQEKATKLKSKQRPSDPVDHILR